MKTVAVILALFAFCGLASAQTSTGSQLSPSVRIYEPKNLDVSHAMRVAKFVGTVVNCTVAWEDVPHAIVIRALDPGQLDAAEALLKRFDVPEPKQPERQAAPKIDCTVYLIRASSSGSRTEPPTSPVPAELQPAIDEMKRSFGYDRYTLWDSLTVQAGGGGEMQGILAMERTAVPYVYSMSYRSAGSDGSRDFYLSGFQFSVKMPSDFFKDGIETHIKTDVTIREGQKLVLGKLRLLPAENADLFLVLATKVH
jgi:hypothetical protein